MLGKAPTLRLASALVLAAGVVFAMPLAGAFGMGIDAASVTEMKNAGATPQFGQTWVGHWMERYGWGGFEDDLTDMREAGVTPVIMWYYYGDSISPSCVKYGCDGRTKSEWDTMAKSLATRAKAIMGTKPFYVVLEPEFQKNGIEDWDTFDGYLANQANIMRTNAPSAEIVIGFGHWGEWSLFDRAVAAADLTGFQVLRGSTRDSSATATGTIDYMIGLAKRLKADWGKPVIVFDLGIATYGGWEGVQEKALQNILAKRSELDAAGVKFVVWRYVHDNDHSSGYFGAAESSWGVIRKDGSKKPAYNELVSLIKGSSSTSTTTSTSTSTSTSTTTSTTSSVFSGVKGNEWWIQAKVAHSPTSVQTRVDGGSWISLSYKSWGAWAVSTRAPTGSVVELRAVFSDGAVKTASYKWPTATPISGTTTGSTSLVNTATFDATFSGIKVQEWWVQTSVGASQTVVKVEARVNGGTWQPLTKQSWGGWAKSIHVYTGQKVEFRATSGSGATDISGGYYR